MQGKYGSEILLSAVVVNKLRERSKEIISVFDLSISDVTITVKAGAPKTSLFSQKVSAYLLEDIAITVESNLTNCRGMKYISGIDLSEIIIGSVKKLNSLSWSEKDSALTEVVKIICKIFTNQDFNFWIKDQAKDYMHGF
jgi:hypothetical protein